MTLLYDQKERGKRYYRPRYDPDLPEVAPTDTRTVVEESWLVKLGRRE